MDRFAVRLEDLLVAYPDLADVLYLARGAARCAAQPEIAYCRSDTLDDLAGRTQAILRRMPATSTAAQLRHLEATELVVAVIARLMPTNCNHEGTCAAQPVDETRKIAERAMAAARCRLAARGPQPRWIKRPPRNGGLGSSG